MKRIFHALMALCLMLFSNLVVSAQNESKEKNIEFKVTGNCGMCKKTIETSLKGKPGINQAIWDKETKIMKVIYNPAKITEEQIHQKIADSGYDTEKKKASDKIYNTLPECCQYQRTINSNN